MPIHDVSHYLSALTQPEIAALDKVRQIVRKLAPTAVEGIYYGVPGFRVEGKYLMGYGASKKHLSIYPASRAIELFKDKLEKFILSKGTIRFTVDNQVPAKLLTEILKVRLKDLSEVEK